MCRKLIVATSTALLLLFQHGSAQQVTIQPAIPSVGMLQATQLWNISAINATAVSQAIRIELAVVDRVSGQEVLQAESTEMTLKPGATLLNSMLAGPVRYSPASFFTGLSGRSFLPVGQYSLCYTLFEEVNKKLIPTGKECIAVDVEPMTPPYLNYPFHEAVISEKNPRFVWMPPTPTQLFSALQYDFLLVEKQTTQTPEEAIQRNTPIMTVGNLPSNSFGYNGIGMSGLDTGKHYAWQVIAKNGASYGVKSEVWSFSVSGADSLKALTGAVFRMSDDIDRLGKSVVSNIDRMVFHYVSRSPEAGGLIEVFEAGKADKAVYSKKTAMLFGDNYYLLKPGPWLKNGGVFMVFLSVNGVRKSGAIIEVLK